MASTSSSSRWRARSARSFVAPQQDKNISLTSEFFACLLWTLLFSVSASVVGWISPGTEHYLGGLFLVPACLSVSPALTVRILDSLLGRITRLECCSLILTHLGAALSAGVLLRVFLPPEYLTGPITPVGSSHVMAFFAEGILTVLFLVTLHTIPTFALVNRLPSKLPCYVALFIAFLGSFSSGPLLNPLYAIALDVAASIPSEPECVALFQSPAVISSTCWSFLEKALGGPGLWVYTLGPIIGSFFGGRAIAFAFPLEDQTPETTPQDTSSAADKKKKN